MHAFVKLIINVYDDDDDDDDYKEGKSFFKFYSFCSNILKIPSLDHIAFKFNIILSSSSKDANHL